MSIQTMKQTNRQTKTIHRYIHIARAQVQLNRWQKKEGFDAFNLTLCFFIGDIYSFCLFFFYIESVLFFMHFFRNHIPLCTASHRSHLFEFFILNSQFLLLYTFSRSISSVLYSPKTWHRFIGSCLAIKVPINDKKIRTKNM